MFGAAKFFKSSVLLVLALLAYSSISLAFNTNSRQEVDWITLLNLTIGQQQELTQIEKKYRKDSAALQKKYNQCGPTSAFKEQLETLKSERQEAMRAVLSSAQLAQANQILANNYRNKHLTNVRQMADYLMLTEPEVQRLYRRINTQIEAIQWPLGISQYLATKASFMRLLENTLSQEQYQRWQNKMGGSDSPKAWPSIEQFYLSCQSKFLDSSERYAQLEK